MSDGVSQASPSFTSRLIGWRRRDRRRLRRRIWPITGLVRTLAERDADKPAALWILTRRFTESVAPSALRQSFLWGPLPVSSPPDIELWGGLVDRDQRRLRQFGPALAELRAKPSKSILVRRDVVLADAWLPSVASRRASHLQCRPDAACPHHRLGALATDGRLARRPRRSSISVDRPHAIAAAAGLATRPSTPSCAGGSTRSRALEMRGVTVEAVAPTSAAARNVQATMAARDRDGAPIRGVIHAAGITNDQLVTSTDRRAVTGYVAEDRRRPGPPHDAFPPGWRGLLLLDRLICQDIQHSGRGSYAANSADALARRMATGLPHHEPPTG